MERTRRDYIGILFVLPSLLGFVFFFAAPFFLSIIYSFTRSIGSFNFVGLKNYIDLFNSESFALAFSNTFKFIGAGIPLLVSISLLLAVIFIHLINKSPVAPHFLTANITSMVIPSAAVILFVQVLFERYGVINKAFGGGVITDYLRSEYAFYIILVLFLWKNLSYSMIIFITAIGQIDKSIYEAAELDGANASKKFFYMTVPLIKPTIVFVIIMGIIGIFKMFRESYLLTGDYPHSSIYSLQNFMNNNFYNLNYQRLSAASVLFFLIMSVAVVLMLRVRHEG